MECKLNLGRMRVELGTCVENWLCVSPNWPRLCGEQDGQAVWKDPKP